ncbi:MAG: cell division protein FtsQ [Cytophagales bacterium]|nr:MAG: cell division protein FtsQ [Cytophagales bacterium]
MIFNFLKNFKYKLLFAVSVIAVGIVLAIVFVENKISQKTLSNIVVNIQNQYENYFIDEREVLRLLSNDDRELLIHRHYDSINLKKLEQRILAHNFVQNAQVSKDLKGNLIVDIEQCKPIGRLIPSDGEGAYISEYGELLATSEKFTSRVMIIDGSFTRKMMSPDFFNTDEGMAYFQLLSFINHDSFWKAFVAQFTIDSYGDITLTPQIGSEEIEFGTPENFEHKLEKLKLFYKKVIPVKGWNTYKSIKLKFKNQIVCEKNIASI